MIEISMFLKIFFILQYLCVFYTEFFKKRKWNVFMRVVIIVLMGHTFYGGIISLKQQKNVYFATVAMFNFADYAIAVIFSFIGGNVLCHYHRKLAQLDHIMRWGKVRLPISITVSVFVILLMEKSFIGWGYFVSLKNRSFKFSGSNLLGFVTWYMMKFGILFNDFTRNLIFEWNWAYVKSLRKAFQDTAFKENKFATNLQTSDINRTIFGYIGTLESLNSMGFTFKILVLWNFCFAFIYILLTTVGIVYTPTKEVNLYMSAEALYHMAIFTYPCVIIELARSEVDKIKLILTEIYTQSLDDKIVAKAEDALKLLEVHPFEVVVCRLISINIRLPLHFLALITTYVIVTIQFTHAFE